MAGRKLFVGVVVFVFLSSLGAASPALELFNGELEMNNNNITNLDFLNGNNADDLSFLGSSIGSGELAAGSVDNSSLVSTDAYTLDKLFLQTTLGATNLTLDGDDFASGDTLDVASIDNGEIDAGAVNNGSIDSSDAYTFNFVSVNTALADGNISNDLSSQNHVELDGTDSMNGSLDLGGNGITNVNTLSVSQPLADGNISNDLFVSFSPALEPGNLSLSGELTGDGSGNLEIASGAITEAGQELAAGAVNSTAIKNGSVKGGDIAQEGATSGEVLEWDGSKWAPATDDGGGTINNASLDSTDDYTMNSLNTTGTIGLELNGGDIEDGTNTIYDGGNTEVPNGIVEGLANFASNDVLSGFPLGSSDLGAGAVGGSELSQNGGSGVVNETHIQSQVTTGALVGGADTKFDIATGGIDEAGNYLAAGSVNATAARLGSSGGVKDDGSGNIVVEPADFAGTFLSDDGSDLLDVDVGFGLENDGSGNIRVDEDGGFHWTAAHNFDVALEPSNLSLSAELTDDGSGNLVLADGAVDGGDNDIAAAGVNNTAIGSGAVEGSAGANVDSIADGSVGNADLDSTGPAVAGSSGAGTDVVEDGSIGPNEIDSAGSTYTVAKANFTTAVQIEGNTTAFPTCGGATFGQMRMWSGGTKDGELMYCNGTVDWEQISP